MTTKPSLKIGAVSVKPVDDGVWEIRHYEAGRYIRRRVTCSERDARAMAGHLNAELVAGKGFLPAKAKRSTAPTLAEGLALAIEARNTIPATVKDRSQRGALFVRWMAEHHAAVKTWADVKPAMVQGYVVAMEKRGLAFDTVRLALAPVKLAWSYIRDNYPKALPALPKIKVKPAPRRDVECLEADEVAALLDWLKDQDTGHFAMAALAALAGLRVLEVAALRRQDVDLDAGTVTIRTTAHHAVKTRDSERTIPVCAEVREALAAALNAQKIIPATGEIFVNALGNLWVKDALGLLWRRNLKRAAKDTGVSRLAEIPIHRLRSAFATMAGRLGAPDRLLKAYIGHAAGDVLGGHYRKIDLAELKTVSASMDRWRTPAGEGQTEGETSKIPTTPLAEGLAEG